MRTLFDTMFLLPFSSSNQLLTEMNWYSSFCEPTLDHPSPEPFSIPHKSFLDAILRSSRNKKLCNMTGRYIGLCCPPPLQKHRRNPPKGTTLYLVDSLGTKEDWSSQTSETFQESLFSESVHIVRWCAYNMVLLTSLTNTGEAHWLWGQGMLATSPDMIWLL